MHYVRHIITPSSTARCHSLDFDLLTHQSLDTRSTATRYAPRGTTRCSSHFRHHASRPRLRLRRSSKDYARALKSWITFSLLSTLWGKHDELNDNPQQDDDVDEEEGLKDSNRNH